MGVGTAKGFPVPSTLGARLCETSIFKKYCTEKN
ncbi:hypothetical protein OOU_Y34scaffold00346g6 [Pyricularia oryzae Y34]|uniref:Uncharacterized protein n=1 Tax=Pyricularia oryzae (strain Y34) TaxID=1143189 RepID=A0AA97P335_PYRO3|nr:hypothetical protein OOU_Y34scaffold00346g6 [Pyricularia oryzae Y34]